jgi:O-antigen ligase
LLRSSFIAVLLLLVTCGVTFVTLEELGFPVEPYWMVLPVLVIPLAWLVIRRFPAALIPTLGCVGIFKVQAAASNLDFSDPTLWILFLLAGTILVHITLTLVGLERPSLGNLVRGQVGGVVTYLVFAGVIALSYLHSLAPEYGFKAMIRFVVIGSILFFAPFLLVRSERDIRHLLTGALLLSMLLVGHEFLVRQPETVEGASRLGQGEWIGTALLLLLLAPKSVRVPLPRSLLLICLLFLAIGLGISIARGPTLSFLFVLVFGLLTTKEEFGLLPRKTMAVILLLLTVPTVMVSSSFLEKAAPQELQRKKEELSKLAKFSDPGGTAGERLFYYKQALDGFGEKPFWGWGIGSFSVYSGGVDKRLYPHNLVLLVAMEQGLAGLAALTALSVAIACALKKIIVITGGEWRFLFWIVLFCLSTSMFSGDLDSQRALLMWCGVAFASSRMLSVRMQKQPQTFAAATASCGEPRTESMEQLFTASAKALWNPKRLASGTGRGQRA